MTTCWKCGKPTANNTSECDECDAAPPPPGELKDMLRDLAASIKSRTYVIDWDAVKTEADIVLLLRNIFHTLTFTPDYRIPEDLKPFLKPFP